MLKPATPSGLSEEAHGAAAQSSLLRRMLANGPFSLALQLLFAIAPTFILWVMIQGGSINDSNFRTSILLLTISAAAVWFVMTKLRVYAKSRLLSYVFPVNFFIYSSLFSIIAVLRLNYSAYQLLLGAAGGIFASLVITILARNSMRFQYVIPGGRTDEIVLSGQYIAAPSLVEVRSLVEAQRLNGSIVADLHHDHSPEWKRLFAEVSLAGLAVYHYRQIAEMQSGQVKISHLSENDLGSLIPNAPYTSTKRLIDIAVSLLLLPVFLIVALFVAILIKIELAGRSVLYSGACWFSR